MERVFSIQLSRRTAALSRGTPVTLLQADKAPTLPAALAAVHAQVAAFAPLPAMRPRLHEGLARRRSPTTATALTGRIGSTTSNRPITYPSYQTATGRGRTIGIVAACDFLDSDLSLYFGHENLPVPKVVRRPVDGGSPPFDINNGDCDEVSLDVQQSGGSAPGATIMVYEAPDASIAPSFLDMDTAIVEDNKADVVSTSFGLCELYFTAAYNGGEDFTYLRDTVPRHLSAR